MTKEIPLSRGKVALVDDEDYEWLSQWKWSYRPSRRKEYAGRVEKDAAGIGHTIHMHRVIAGASGNQLVDHTNGNGLDNRRGNLRICDTKTNAYNKRVQRNKQSSPYKGVYRDRSRWRATIYVDGRYHCLGSFDTQLEAARAYDAAAVQFHGEFALLNLP